MNGASVLVAALENEGVKQIFGVPGEENLDIVDALRRSTNESLLLGPKNLDRQLHWWPCGYEHGGDMRSKECQNTAETLRRVARSTTDQTIADRLEALAKGYERSAKKASLIDHALVGPVTRVEGEGSTQEDEARPAIRRV